VLCAYGATGKTYLLHSIALYTGMYMAGGFGAVVWGGAVRQVAMWWVTWIVNRWVHSVIQGVLCLRLGIWPQVHLSALQIVLKC
jgi:hypothetical protein